MEQPVFVECNKFFFFSVAQFNFDEKKVLPKPRAFAQQKQLLPQIRSLQYQVSHCFSTSSNAIFKKTNSMCHNFLWYCWKAKNKNPDPFCLIQTTKQKHGGDRSVVSNGTCWWPRPERSILLVDSIIPNPAFHIGPFVSKHIWISLQGTKHFLGGGFNDCLFSSLFGEMIQFDWYFSDGLKPPTSFGGFVNNDVTLRHPIEFLLRCFRCFFYFGMFWGVPKTPSQVRCLDV